MADFTLKVYKCILVNLMKLGYGLYPIKKYQNTVKKEKVVYLRHDVDRKPKNAYNMAVLENSLGICSTYYFRVQRCSFDKNIIKKIVNLGHEIGYHYDDLARFNGNYKLAINNFGRNLEKLRKLYPVVSIVMHGSPLSKYDNRDLWKKYNYKKYGIKYEVYFDVNYQEIVYFNDTGRTWNSDSSNLRDFIFGKHLRINRKISGSFDLLKYIEKKCKNKDIILSTHPERWSNDFFDYVYQWWLDKTINVIKNLIKIVRKK